MDPEWIESMNTVMDDNKVLTLVSNERIPLSPSMRLILEVGDLRCATPATVSRGGVLFINDGDIGWGPYLNSWKETLIPEAKKEDEAIYFKVAKTQFELSYDAPWFKDGLFKELKGKMEMVAPIRDIAVIHTITCILNDLVNNAENKKSIKGLGEEEMKNIFSGLFYFATMWAFGGIVGDDVGAKSKKM